MKRENTYDFIAKLLIIGDSGVGKTNILFRFCENNFMESHLSTIGIDFKIKTIEVEGKKIRMQIWDTAGQQRFKTITQSYYKGAMGIILVYSINDRNSFSSLENWSKQIKMHASQHVVKVLVGNKCDCEDRKVAFDQGKAMAQNLGVNFMEVSAKENTNIQQVFHFMAKQIKQNILMKEVTLYPSKQTGKLGGEKKRKKRSWC